MPPEQAVRYILEQGKAVSANEWDGCGNRCARAACIIRVYRKGLALRRAGQLYTKRLLGEESRKDRQFKTESEKQAVRKEAGGLAV